MSPAPPPPQACGGGRGDGKNPFSD